MARARKVQVPTLTTDIQAVTGSGVLIGYSFRESAGTAAVATLILRDGTTATADILVIIEAGLNTSGTQWFGPQGLPFNVGIYVDRIAGETEGVLYVG